jgi:hypothetical protein
LEVIGVNVKRERNNPQKIFKEQDDLVVSGKETQTEADKLSSIRYSEITSIAPDDIDWNNIYVGKQHGLHSVKPEVSSRKKERI